MAFQIRPDRAHDFSAPISSAFREFSIYSLPDATDAKQRPGKQFLSSRLFTSPLGSLWGQRAPTQNSEEPSLLEGLFQSGSGCGGACRWQMASLGLFAAGDSPGKLPLRLPVQGRSPSFLDSFLVADCRRLTIAMVG